MSIYMIHNQNLWKNTCIFFDTSNLIKNCFVHFPYRYDICMWQLISSLIATRKIYLTWLVEEKE